MSESEKHQELIKLAVNCVFSLVPENNKVLVECDTPETKRPTHILGGYIPDVYYEFDKQLIIGEAKTYKDFSTRHSQDQIEAYLITLDASASYESVTLVISIPWEITAQAFNYLKAKKLKHNQSIKIIIITDGNKRYYL